VYASPAFLPKARDKICIRQVFWLYFISWPSRVNSGDVKEMCRKKLQPSIYSYGDSAGIKPDFPFNEFPYRDDSTECMAKMN
jgi:hypothetical protein